MSSVSRILSALTSAVLVTASSAFAAPGLEDVQVGERELQTRIALICEGVCTLEKRSDDSFFLPGVSAAMKLDLSDRSHNIRGFTIAEDAEGSVLSIDADRLIEYANAKPCRIKDRQAMCVDMFFADARPQQAQIETPKLERAETTPQPPVLRESEPERLSRFARLGPPERLAPPTGARLASIQPSLKPEESVTRPLIRGGGDAKNVTGSFDYAAQVKLILGKTLSPGYCASAKAALQVDPWALEEMADVGLCEAAAGNAETAEQVLSRLLEYTPDNYEAHVGRALVAQQAGEKSVARRYFQDALNAPPPIAESNRIVAAMNKL